MERLGIQDINGHIRIVAGVRPICEMLGTTKQATAHARTIVRAVNTANAKRREVHHA